MSVIGIYRQLRLGWRLTDLEPDLCAVRSVGNLPMQISEKRHLFVQVGHVGVVRDTSALSAKTTGTLKPIHCRSFGFKPRSANASSCCSANQSSRLAECFSESLKLDSDSATSARVPSPIFRRNTLPSTVRKNRSPKPFRAISVTDSVQSQRHCSSNRFASRCSMSNDMRVLVGAASNCRTTLVVDEIRRLHSIDPDGDCQNPQ
jgi:hypothetical protein